MSKTLRIVCSFSRLFHYVFWQKTIAKFCGKVKLWSLNTPRYTSGTFCSVEAVADAREAAVTIWFGETFEANDGRRLTGKRHVCWRPRSLLACLIFCTRFFVFVSFLGSMLWERHKTRRLVWMQKRHTFLHDIALSIVRCGDGFEALAILSRGSLCLCQMGNKYTFG